LTATAATYNGTHVRTYPQYLDMGNSEETLVAQPRNTYQVSLSVAWYGLLPATPGDGRWTVVTRGPVTFGAIPGEALPGAMILGFPGYPRPSYSAVLGEAGEDGLAWPQRVMAAAGEDQIPGAICGQLDQAAVQVAALRRRSPETPAGR